MADKVRLTRTDGSGNEYILHPETTADQIVDLTTTMKAVFVSGAAGAQAYVPVPSTFYYHPSLFTSDRTSITIPKDTAFVVSGRYYRVTTATQINVGDFVDVNDRKGKDLYIYACENADYASINPVFVVSLRSTFPEGYTDTTSRKIGGFHCLCADVGDISGHALTGYVAGDILPASIWDLKHRPECTPEGMVYSDDLHLWIDIYLASVLSTTDFTLQSVNGAVIADGTSSPKFHWYKFAQWMANSGKRLPDQAEFISFSTGSNQGTNISGSADPNTTGGHVDTASPSRRMISNIGCEDCCGVLWQWGNEAGGPYAGASWANAYDGNDDAGQRGQGYNVPNRALFGAVWYHGVPCGSRASGWDLAPLALGGFISARGVCVSRAY